MARPEGAGTQALRVLRLDHALRRAEAPTWLDELARTHAVTPRTIRRDLHVVALAAEPDHRLELHHGAVWLAPRGSAR